MIVFHGSNVIVDEPKTMPSYRFLDFGVGFYATANKEQAERWANKVSLRNKTNTKIVSSYEFDLIKAELELKILKFDAATEEWLDFVCACRTSKQEKEYDIVIGPVADDNVYAVIKLFETGTYDKEETLKRLKIRNIQQTHNIIKRLRWRGCGYN